MSKQEVDLVNEWDRFLAAHKTKSAGCRGCLKMLTGLRAIHADMTRAATGIGRGPHVARIARLIAEAEDGLGRE